MSIEIITDHKPRPMRPFNALPKKAQKDFDYLTPEQQDDLRFVEYKGEWYDAVDTQRISMDTRGSMGWNMVVAADHPFAKWHAVASDSYFSGMLFRFDWNMDTCIIGRYYS